MNINPAVDALLNEKGHPLTNEIQWVREIILGAHPEIVETVKWSCPTFMYKGNMASINLNAQKHVSLMFHKGAMMTDSSGLLEGDGRETRTAKLEDMTAIEKRRHDLEKVVRKWVELQDSQ